MPCAAQDLFVAATVHAQLGFQEEEHHTPAHDKVFCNDQLALLNFAKTCMQCAQCMPVARHVFFVIKGLCSMIATA